MLHRGLAVVLAASLTACGAGVAPGQRGDPLPSHDDANAPAKPATQRGGSTRPTVPHRMWGGAPGPEQTWTLGRRGGARAAKELVQAIEGPSESAFAVAVAFLERDLDLGPAAIPEDAIEDMLWQHYAVAESRPDATAWLLAIARHGGRRSQRRLAVDAEVLPAPEDRERHIAAMDAVGMLCSRGIALEATGLRTLALGLQAHSSVRGAAAYALGRCAGPSAELLAGTERRTLVGLLGDMLNTTDDNEARLAWIALARLGELPQAIPDAILASAPPPWWVEVEAVRALASHADGRAVLVERLARLDGPFEAPRVHVVLEALRGLRNSIEGNPVPLATLTNWGAALEDAALEREALAAAGMASAANARAAKAFALVRCEWRLLAAIGSGDVTAVEGCGRGAETGLPATYGEVLAIEALVHARTRLAGGKGSAPEHPISKLLARAADPRPEVAEAAIAAMADIDDERVNAVVRAALERDDLGVRTAAAATIAGRAMEASRRDAEATDPLTRIVVELADEGSIEARVTAIDALAALARSKPVLQGTTVNERQAEPWLERVMLPLATEPHAAVRARARAALADAPDALARFDTATASTWTPAPAVTRAIEDAASHPTAGLRVHTDAGVFTIDFTDAPAPIAQAVITHLARNGFFTNLTFHRVVPGFVVQGGDPRGDGYGGPGYVMPCERSNLHYERGTVGIALAGKDTGGSQWFITHTRQPHLDGRYTVIGHVDAKGMDIVDRILPFDRILRIDPIPPLE